MIVIYNLAGLLLGGAGILLGIIVAALLNSLGAGFIVIAIAWAVGGYWWRNREIEPGMRHAFPSLFFIPLPVFAVPCVLVSLPMFLADMNRGPVDPRRSLLNADGRTRRRRIYASS